MNKYAILFEYFRECPYLENLMSLASSTGCGETVIMTQGASPTRQYMEDIDVLGNYSGRIIPHPSVYEDFQINCYVFYDTKDRNAPQSNENVLTYEQVCGVCDWIEEQNDLNTFPEIGEQIISIECEPFVPQFLGVDEATNTACYFITVRLRYVNRRQRKSFEYECES